MMTVVGEMGTDYLIGKKDRLLGSCLHFNTHFINVSSMIFLKRGMIRTLTLHQQQKINKYLAVQLSLINFSPT